MDDAGFDLWLNALEKTEGCKENAVREYIHRLREEKDDAVNNSWEVEARLSAHLPGEPGSAAERVDRLAADSEQNADLYQDLGNELGQEIERLEKERDAIEAALVCVIASGGTIEDLLSAQKLLEKLQADRELKAELDKAAALDELNKDAFNDDPDEPTQPDAIKLLARATDQVKACDCYAPRCPVRRKSVGGLPCSRHAGHDGQHRHDPIGGADPIYWGS